MKTILVPTDFSATSKNAALYAVELANQLSAAKMILYNAYQAPVVTEPTMPVMQMLDIETLKKISDHGMKLFKSSLQLQNINIQIEEINEFAVLPNSIDEVCTRTGADLIVMGITGASKFEEVLIGSTAISVVKNTKVPVIIIPPNAKCDKIERVMLACDYKKVEETAPLQPIKELLEATNAKLLVLNINQRQGSTDKSQNELLQMLHNYNPEIHSINTEDFIGGINDFAASNNIDMIITIPKKHGLFEGLFKESHTKQLAFHSHVPLMCIHEEDL
ncbi:MAG: universal stress protein [Segetibacter sp.]|nr:universal stress protein [Segetibacter sp.]